MGFIFKVQGSERDPTSRVVGDRKVDNVLPTPRNASVHQRFKRKSVDALNPPYQNVEALAPSYRRVEVFAPDCFNVNAFHPPQCSVDISAPVHDSVDATAPGYYSVDAYCFAPECSYPDSSVDAYCFAPECSYPDSSVEAPAPYIFSVDANIAPNFATVEAQTKTATDSTVPDYSVEVPDPDYYPVDHILAPRIYSVEAHIMKLPCSEFAPKKYSVAPEVVAKCPRQDSV